MKSYLYTIVLLEFAFLCSHSSISFCQDYYVKGQYRLLRSHYSGNLVDGMKVTSLARTLLPGYNVSLANDIWYWGYRYSIHLQENDKRGVTIQVGIFPSVTEAEEVALDYLNSVSAMYHEGPVQGEKIGDSCWYAFNSSTKYLSFLRKNVFLMLSVDDTIPDPSIRLLELCRAVDSDIMNGASYVTFADTPVPPVINSVQISKSELREGETATVTVLATDPKGKRIDYQKSIEFAKSFSGPSNLFSMRYSKDSTPAQYFGTTQTFSVWAVNEDNLFSRKKDFQITF